MQDNQDKEKVRMKYKTEYKNPGEGEIFRTRHYETPSLLYNGNRDSFPGVKRPGRGVDPPPPI